MVTRERFRALLNWTYADRYGGDPIRSARAWALMSANFRLREPDPPACTAPPVNPLLPERYTPWPRPTS